jgi:hypothetical protein
MSPAKQFRELILALLGIAVAAGIARAQPVCRAFWTVAKRRGHPSHGRGHPGTSQGVAQGGHHSMSSSSRRYSSDWTRQS